MIATIAATTAAVLTGPAAGLLTLRAAKRALLARRLRITSANGIDEAGYLRIGGIDQYVSIRGEDLRNPVILEIHGGPGASQLVYTHRTRTWEKHFTVVRWDMRGACKTFLRSGPDGQGTYDLDQLHRDALELTDLIRTRLGVDKLLLVASSLGTVTGLRLARDHPERYSAYVGTDQNAIGGGRDRVAYRNLLQRLTTAGRTRELATITAMGPDAASWTTHQWADYYKVLVTTDPLTFDTMKTVVVRSIFFSPLLTLREVRGYFKAMNWAEKLGPAAMTTDEWADGTHFRIPIFVFQGEHDVITPAAPAKQLFDDITAPVKDFALIEGCSHFASFRNPERFLELLLTKVRPALGA
ncbi:alpha/beta fold hydrolase [Kitasatospora sp. NPDC006697]|uniref:alpha/beta fold hydrolase n=1 Tax=Kitasatospora sp. NPDC006697 TaxID=3364020 RepID=UPI00367A0688